MSPPSDDPPVTVTPLRKVLEDKNHRLAIGSATGGTWGRNDALGAQHMTVLAREFNVLTPENEMKFGPLRPSRTTFNFTRADSMVAWAKLNNMKVRGHTLVWHSQNASWLTSGSWTRDQAIAIMEEHITTVMTHWKGQLAAWDVVNEGFDDAAKFRTTVWGGLIGRDYVEKAFRAARAADPDVKLFYNDYNIEGANAKSDSTYELIKSLKAAGVPIDGIGMQMHLIAGQLSIGSVQENFTRFAALGLKIHITELDVRVATPATAAALETQAANYRDVVSLCAQTPACEMVVVWGFTDRDSWIPNTFPGWGDALLFDGNYQPKPAYTAVRNVLVGL